MHTEQPARELDSLATANDLLIAARKNVTAKVVKARQAGASWAQIGATLRMTKQGAMKTYRAAVEQADRKAPREDFLALDPECDCRPAADGTHEADCATQPTLPVRLEPIPAAVLEPIPAEAMAIVTETEAAAVAAAAFGPVQACICMTTTGLDADGRCRRHPKAHEEKTPTLAETPDVVSKRCAQRHHRQCTGCGCRCHTR